jgi:GTP:adenosylcobinamide-phosphate guanylyltransferase/aminoglycoside phosphotransferase
MTLTVIVQAGGRGSRLRHHTWNKPKCLVSVHGKPLLYHLFDKFPDASFIIIGDYLYEQLQNYLQVDPPAVNYKLIHTEEKGTCAGIGAALAMVPAEQPVLLTWSDLIINDIAAFPEGNTDPVVYLTDAFTCRWSMQVNVLEEVPSDINGVPGIFYFAKSTQCPTPPESGEFVKWFSQAVPNFSTVAANALEELGDFRTIEDNNSKLGFCRFFNKVDVQHDIVVKQAIDLDYAHLIQQEIAWYNAVTNLGFTRIPRIHKASKYLTMSRIQGKHIWEIENLTERDQRSILSDIIYTLQDLHRKGYHPSNASEVKRVYIDKTQSRVNSVSKIIPGFDKASFTVNGVKCINLFHNTHAHLWDQINDALQPLWFTPIHGDPTFSNTIIDHNLKAWFIDPRGYFDKPGIYGDPVYDFAKVYYSAVGGYDNFNRRKFKLHIDEDTCEILMTAPSTAGVAESVFEELLPDCVSKIELLHGLIWLALSGYAKDDIDSVIGSFYYGLYWLNKGLKKIQ